MSTTLSHEDDELPSLISCRVCDAMLDITKKRDQHVVRCDYCGEATAIRDAPSGKKYIRCVSCNCLLICKATAQKISCPRPTCKKVIILYKPNTTNATNIIDLTPVPGMCRVDCGHCGETFLFNALVNGLALCPICERKSSVGPDFARSRSLIFFTFALIFMTIGVVTTILTYNRFMADEKGWIAAYLISFLVALYFVFRSIYFCRIKKSKIITSQSSA